MTRDLFRFRLGRKTDLSEALIHPSNMPLKTGQTPAAMRTIYSLESYSFVLNDDLQTVITFSSHPSTGELKKQHFSFGPELKSTLAAMEDDEVRPGWLPELGEWFPPNSDQAFRVFEIEGRRSVGWRASDVDGREPSDLLGTPSNPVAYGAACFTPWVSSFEDLLGDLRRA